MKLIRAEGARERINWLLAYEGYMQSTIWGEKRRKVLERVRRTHGGMCEGCGERRAEEVHHVRYPRGLEPGSRGWVAKEKLYDLVGICERCHEEVHSEWEAS